jgi:hypothetical protein
MGDINLQYHIIYILHITMHMIIQICLVTDIIPIQRERERERERKSVTK